VGIGAAAARRSSGEDNPAGEAAEALDHRSSTGSQIVCTAVDQMCKRDDVCNADLGIDHIILTAPDFNRDNLMSISRRSC